MVESRSGTRVTARKPKGFPDKTAAIIETERRLADSIIRVYRHWGFDLIDTGPFEYSDALGKFLPDSDRPNAGVFSLMDEDAEWMSLRYDLTAPLARYFAENRDRLTKPFRRCAVGPVWRNEKPGPFRFREFIQCDADSVGASTPLADAEMIAMACEALQATGMKDGDYAIRINSRELLDGIMSRIGLHDPEQKVIILRALDKMDRLGISGVEALLGAGRKDESGAFTEGAKLSSAQINPLLDFVQAGKRTRSATLDTLSNLLGDTQRGHAGLESLHQINTLLGKLGISEDAAPFDPSIVRGLDYYTGVVFEAEYLQSFTNEKGQNTRFGSIGGGGRYDGLIARFCDEHMPATGFSVGITRLASVLTHTDRNLHRNGPVVVLILDRDHLSDYAAIANELRQGGICAETYHGSSGMRAQMKYADRRNAPAVIIVGQNEREANRVTIKDLKIGAEKAVAIKNNTEWRETRPGQFEVARSDMLTHIQKIVGNS